MFAAEPAVVIVVMSYAVTVLLFVGAAVGAESPLRAMQSGKAPAGRV